MKTTNKPGQATLAVLIALTLVMVEVGMLVSAASISNYTNGKESVEATQSLLLVDSAIEDILYRLKTDPDFAGGTVSIGGAQVDVAITDIAENNKQVVIETLNTDVYRKLSVIVHVESQTSNPYGDFATYSNDYTRIRDGGQVIGNVWTNDYLEVRYDNSLIQGDAFATTPSTDTNVRDDARIEGDLTAVNRIRVRNDGVVTGTATSADDVWIQSGGSVGNSVVDPSLTLEDIPSPEFDFDHYKSVAQGAGTYYNSTSSFISFLNLNGNTTPGGIYYIGSSSTLNLNSNTTYNINGTIITEGQIQITGRTYNHTAQNNLPALVSKQAIRFIDNSSCNCKANVSGVIFTDSYFEINRDSFTGSGKSAEITGAVWAGDTIDVFDNGRITYNSAIANGVQGFTFAAQEPEPPAPTGGVETILDTAVWAGDDFNTDQAWGNPSTVVGNVWVSDNYDMYGWSTRHYGNAYARGENSSTASEIDGGAKLLDDPATTAVEGNMTSIRNINVINWGSQIEKTASSKGTVTTTNGATVGTKVEDPALTIDDIAPPAFDFNTYKALAQSSGVIHNSPSAFESYLQSHSNTITGIHYINSTSSLFLLQNVNLTGTLISDGTIEIRSASYHQTATNNLPAIVSKGDVIIEDSWYGNSTVTINGVIFAQQDITLGRYTPSGAQWAIDIVGSLWALDDVNFGRNSRVTNNTAGLLSGLTGFGDLGEESGEVSGEGTSNSLEVVSWEID